MRRAILAVAIAAVLSVLALAQGALPIQITSVQVKDYQGNVRTVFKRGEIIIVETTIEVPPAYYYYAPPSIKYLELITMWFGNTMMGLTLTRGTISPGETKTFGGGFTTRTGDPTGTYTFWIYVWNGFPSEMGANWAPLAERKAVSVTVNP